MNSNRSSFSNISSDKSELVRQDVECHEKVAKIALVTGSATGIGANIALDLASAGFTVIVTGRNVDKMNKVVQQCNEISSASKHVSFIADLYHFDQIDELINFIRIRFGRLDILVNNACWRGDVGNILPESVYDEFQKVMQLNVLVPMYLIHKCLIPLKTKSASALVINISSVASTIVVPLHLYSISKACLSEISRQVALLSQDLDILSVTISPGPILTDERPQHIQMKDLTLMNRVGTTQEISNLVIFVITNAHLFNGKEIFVDGGYLAKQKQVR